MIDEQRAIRRLQQGDINGIDTLVSLYQVQAVHVAYLITQDRGLAEDAVQEAFCLAYKHIKQFDIKRAFKPWFLRIVVNQALQTAKSLKRFTSLDEDESDQLG